MDELKIIYTCPITGKECSNFSQERQDPFTGERTQELCAFGTKDGACAVAKFMQAVVTASNGERWY